MELLHQRNDGDYYWRLPQLPQQPHTYARCTAAQLKESLKTAGYHVPSNSNKGDMLKIAHRKLLHQPEYKNCTTQELRKFSVDRKIPGISSKTTKMAIISSLREADEKLIFHCFSDLPADLRCCVYDEYIADFPSTLQTPTQPPLSRVSKAIRHEVLPMFYSTVDCSFSMNMEDGAWVKWDKEIPSTPFIHFERSHLNFIDSLSAKNLAAVGRWKLILKGYLRVSAIGIDTTSREVTVKTTYGNPSMDHGEVLFPHWSALIRKTVQMTLQRGGGITSSEMRLMPKRLEEARRFMDTRMQIVAMRLGKYDRLFDDKYTDSMYASSGAWL